MIDPLEEKLAGALTRAGLAYSTPASRRDPTGLDFRLANGVEIEVKRFATPRSERQLASAPNVIFLQGVQAVDWFVALLDGASS